MAGDTQITVVGNLTGDPELRFIQSGAAVVNFTVASTPRSFGRYAAGMERFDFASGPALLRRTPALLDVWLRDLPETWLRSDEGPDTWNPQVVVGHLIEGERSDWLPRTRHLLEHGERVAFTPFDRFAQLRRPSRAFGALSFALS